MDVAIVFGILVFAGLSLFTALARASATDAAKKQYITALSKLKLDPTNADLKQATLALGRSYSQLTRDKNGNALFDEVALMNDIGAACAGAGAGGKPSAAQFSSANNIEARLKLLSDLWERGLIEQSEHDRRRAEILANI